jgi:predicted PurR-regulated permease PerM
MTSRPSSPPDDVLPAAPRSYASAILAGFAVLLLLYLGRELLIPIALAAFLSLLIAPLVRRLKRLGLGQVPAVLSSVLVLSLFLAALAGAIFSQVASMAVSLPQYEATIRDKVSVVREATIGRMESMQGEAGRMISRMAGVDAVGSAQKGAGRGGNLLSRSANGVVPVEIQEPEPKPLQTMMLILASVWGPLGSAGIVLIVLIFVLLENESLRDRMIRLMGGADVRATTHAFNDAGARLSRYFVSQFAVNVGVGLLVWVALLCIGLPHAMLWGVLAGLLRFIPYIGFPFAAVSASLLAAAVDPGWALLWLTLGLFAVIELLASQVVEPQLYGHNTGMSPLSVIVAAIFWGWLWGPAGLLLSTPLTLCLVVAGRHVKALAFLDILLGDMPALTLSQRFYQRALSGDADEVIASARQHLKRKSIAHYCDTILMPALELAYGDLQAGNISDQQQRQVREVIVRVIESLGGESSGASSSKRARASVLETSSLGQDLRLRRQARLGKWQGPLVVPAGSITLCISMGNSGDDLVCEILVRILRQRGIDARHLTVNELDGEMPPDASHDSVAITFIVNAFENLASPETVKLASNLRESLPKACLLTLSLVPPRLAQDLSELEGHVDMQAYSFEEAVQVTELRYPPMGVQAGAKVDTSLSKKDLLL